MHTFRFFCWLAAPRPMRLAIVVFFFILFSSVFSVESGDRLASAQQASEPTVPAIPREQQGVFPQAVGNAVGLKGFAPGRWSRVGATVSNRTGEPQVVEATAVIKGNEELRFSRQILVPAMTTRATTIPVHVPENLKSGEVVELVGKIPGTENMEAFELDYLARLSMPTSVAFIRNFSSDVTVRDSGPDFRYESVISFRAAVGLDRRLLMFSERFLPTSIEGWDAIRSVVLAGDRTSDSPAAANALRQWLAEGGRMWIQMNEMSPRTVRDLLGSAIRFEIIDKVLLNSYQIERARSSKLTARVNVELEEPVELIRMIVDDAEIIHTVDGWPAMFKTSFGKGEIYFTALEGRGWLRSRVATDRPYSDPLYYTDFVALDPLREISGILQAESPAPAVVDEVAAGYTMSRVGYEVPSRRMVVTALVAFCMTIGIGAMFFSIWKMREFLGLLTVGGGLFTALIILIPGWNSKKDVPETASSFQVVEMLPQSAQYTASGQLSLFTGQPTEATMLANNITRINPQSETMTGKIRNLLWSDASRWRWRNTLLPPGIQTFQFEHSQALDRPIFATAKLGKDGVTGQLGWPFRDNQETQLLEGGLLVFPGKPALAANVEQDGSFQANINDVLADGQYFNSTFMSDAQRRQQPVLDSWYNHYLKTMNSNPYLLVWCEGLGTGLSWPESVRVLDASLVVVPLMLQPSDANTDVSIPTSLITMRAIISETGQSSVFDNAKQAWVYPHARQSSTRIRFQLPPQTLPLEIKSAKLEVDCNVPSRKLQIFALQGDERKLLAERSNASGRITFNIARDAMPSLDSSGGLALEFVVGQLLSEVEEETMSNSAWSIRKTLLSVTGSRQPDDQK